MQERMPTAAQPEMPPTPSDRSGAPAGTPAHLADPRALQILSTEHWSLLSQRSLAWTETFSRAGMYLSTLSAGTVALALVGSVMRDGFVAFALVILPVILFLGLATAVRLSQAGADDNLTVQGMNRIRNAYLEMVPDLAPYFVTSHYDDISGIMVTMGAPPTVAGQIGQPTVTSMLGGFLHGFVTTIGMIMVINCVVGGVTAAIAAAALGATRESAVVVGFLAVLILFAAQSVWGLRTFRVTADRMTIRFPTPPLGD